MTGTGKTFRGATLDEVLPQIRAELGPEAIILAEREGVVGGIGGFFARKCVGVEAVARGGAPALGLPSDLRVGAVVATPSVPARVATNAYAAASPRSATVAEPEPALTF